MWEVLCGRYSENPSVGRQGRRAGCSNLKIYLCVCVWSTISNSLYLSLILCIASYCSYHLYAWVWLCAILVL